MHKDSFMRCLGLLVSATFFLTGVCRGVEIQGWQTDTSQWSSYAIPWNERMPGTATDMSYLLDPPAGQFGPVTVENGHLAFQGRGRVRFWGINVAEGFPPTHEIATHTADHLSKAGFNLVRVFMHGLYHGESWGGVLSNAHPWWHVDPEYMDRFDYFFFQLKRHGIYLCLDFQLLVDGLMAEKAWSRFYFFDEDFAEEQRWFLTQFFTHTNPYTGLQYSAEPGIALIQLNNESDIFGGWTSGDLDEMSQPNKDALQARFNSWLADKYSTRIALENAWAPQLGVESRYGLLPEEDQFNGTVALKPNSDLYSNYTTARHSDSVQFLTWLEQTRFLDLRNHLRTTLGVDARIPVIGTQLYYGIPSVMAQSSMDVMDNHAYYDHPDGSTGGTWASWVVRNKSEIEWVDDPDADGGSYLLSALLYASFSSVSGKPFVISEFNQPYPSRTLCEAPLMIAAYALLRNWDAVMYFDYNVTDPTWDKERVPPSGFFAVGVNPVQWSLMPIAAQLFLRADAAAANHDFAFQYTVDQAYRSYHDYQFAGASGWLCIPGVNEGRNCHFLRYPAKYDNRRRIVLSPDIWDADRHEDEYSSWATRPAAPYVSETNQIFWHSPGYTPPGYPTPTPTPNPFPRWRLDTPKTQAIIGQFKKPGYSGQTFETSRLKVMTKEPGERAFAAFAVSSLDGQPLSLSNRMLLCTAGRVENAGSIWDGIDKDKNPAGEWNSMYYTLRNWGHAPTLVEPVLARVWVRNTSSRPLYALRLDRQGFPVELLPAWFEGDWFVFDTKSGALNYEITAEGSDIPRGFQIQLSPGVNQSWKGGFAEYSVLVSPLNGFNAPVYLLLRGVLKNLNYRFDPPILEKGGGVSKLTICPSPTSSKLVSRELVARGVGGGFWQEMPFRYVYSTQPLEFAADFEQPDYMPGQLDGQQAWEAITTTIQVVPKSIPDKIEYPPPPGNQSVVWTVPSLTTQAANRYFTNEWELNASIYIEACVNPGVSEETIHPAEEDAVAILGFGDKTFEWGHRGQVIFRKVEHDIMLLIGDRESQTWCGGKPLGVFWSENTWHKIGVEIDFGRQVWNVYIDDAQLGVNECFLQGAIPMSGLYKLTLSGRTIIPLTPVQWDDISISPAWQYGDVQPILSTLSKDSIVLSLSDNIRQTLPGGIVKYLVRANPSLDSGSHTVSLDLGGALPLGWSSWFSPPVISPPEEADLFIQTSMEKGTKSSLRLLITGESDVPVTSATAMLVVSQALPRYDTGFEPPEFTAFQPLHGQGGWIELDGTQLVNVTQENAHIGVQCLKWGSDQVSRVRRMLDDGTYDGLTMVEAYVSPWETSPSGGGGTSCPQLAALSDTGEVICNILFDDTDHTVKAIVGSGNVLGYETRALRARWLPGAWHKVAVMIDIPAAQWDIYIDDILYASREPFILNATPSSLGGVQLSARRGMQQVPVYWDDVRIYPPYFWKQPSSMNYWVLY